MPYHASSANGRIGGHRRLHAKRRRVAFGIRFPRDKINKPNLFYLMFMFGPVPGQEMSGPRPGDGASAGRLNPGGGGGAAPPFRLPAGTLLERVAAWLRATLEITACLAGFGFIAWVERASRRARAR